MCYQCFGCGKCAGINPDPNITMCPMCHRVVDEGVRWCPDCGAYIRPRTGSLASLRKKKRAQADAGLADAGQGADAQPAQAAGRSA